MHVLRTRDTCTHGQLKALSCQQINDLSMATKYKSSLPFLLLPVIRDTPSGKVSGLLVVAVDVWYTQSPLPKLLVNR